MRQQHGVDGVCGQRQRLPVAQAQLLEPLEQAAVDQQLAPAVVQQGLGAGDGAGGTEEFEVHGTGLQRNDDAPRVAEGRAAGLELHQFPGRGPRPLEESVHNPS